ncbi:hypothetical protein IG193_03615 [Infirmifilum lucidum]|uniref:Thaumarchaeal output domain-containing protein n=1 Tax=Infirmifilum lucidum TaxID=2776706 RepID=A0A7L9FIL6_9CREN|nr:hypothetical protein [Infirmifilum lucidum]QOJ79557.1 hypothetical protein IG193_03615 [Infirmifilum lucidum]
MAGTGSLRHDEMVYLKSLANALQELVVSLFEEGVSEILVNPGEDDPYSKIAGRYGISREALLEEAVKRGFLKPVVADRLVFCPKCGNTSFKARYACPSCGSRDVEKNTLFSHVMCGYIGVLESAPKDARGNTLCPKCSRPLGTQDKDWVKIGVTYRCKGCGLTFSVPSTLLECTSCGNVFDHREATYKEIYRYSVDRSILANAYGQVLSKRVAEAIASKGYKVHFNAEIITLSGLKKKVPMLAEKGSEKFVVETVFPREDDAVKAREEVLNAYGRTLDSNEKHLIVAVKAPAELSRKPEHVETIRGDSLEDAIRKLREKLK